MAEEYETVTIPTVKSGDEVVEEKDVPKVWHEHAETAHEARDTVSAMVNDDEAFEGIGLGTGDGQIHGFDRFRVVVYADPPDAMNHLPDDVDGVGVDVLPAPDISDQDG